MGMREKLIKILRVPIFPHELADPTEAVADYLLDNDVVPVVRCKDCKHWGYQENCDPAFKFFCNAEALYAWGRPVRCADDFCSYGERKDN